MIINPIIPIWIMALVSIAIILINIKINNKFSLLRQVIISVLLFLINLRIMIPSQEPAKKIANNLDVLFVVDNTISMIAEDYDGKIKRLEAVKNDCNYIIDKLAGSRFSIITFNNTSQIMIPFTKDATAASNALETMQVVESLYSKGSSLNVSFDDMENSLETSAKNKARKRVVFFISDGEITNEDRLQSFSGLKKYIDGGAVLGYGTKDGGYMKVSSLYSNTSEYLKDNTSSKYPYPNAVSKLDEDNLKKIAKDMGIEYIYMNKKSNIDSNLNEIVRDDYVSNSNLDISSYRDIYYIFVIPLCLLLIYEAISYKRRIFS